MTLKCHWVCAIPSCLSILGSRYNCCITSMFHRTAARCKFSGTLSKQASLNISPKSSNSQRKFSSVRRTIEAGKPVYLQCVIHISAIGVDPQPNPYLKPYTPNPRPVSLTVKLPAQKPCAQKLQHWDRQFTGRRVANAPPPCRA